MERLTETVSDKALKGEDGGDWQTAVGWGNDADGYLEIVKVVRSFDPCMACATHMYNAEGEEISVVTADPCSGTHVETKASAEKRE